MEEKIKIYVSSDVQQILLKDMEYFEFFKTNGELNKNDFINTLIINYFDIYSQKQKDKEDKINEILKKYDCADNQMAMEIVNHLDDYQDNNGKKADCVISLKPTKSSKGTIDFIEVNCLNGATLSGYFRNMFSSYCANAQDKRERIILKERFETIESAIRQHKMIYFTTLSKPEPHIVAPYSIASNQEELFNYLICKNNEKPYSYRISTVLNVRVINQFYQFNEKEENILSKMTINSPSFAYDSFKENELIAVRFTEKGLRNFKRIYYFRPKPVKIEDNVYYFDCSNQQAKTYFERFCKNAVVFQPESLKEEMQKDFFIASKVYKK